MELWESWDSWLIQFLFPFAFFYVRGSLFAPDVVRPLFIKGGKILTILEQNFIPPALLCLKVGNYATIEVEH